jgi:hypothetical protein
MAVRLEREARHLPAKAHGALMGRLSKENDLRTLWHLRHDATIVIFEIEERLTFLASPSPNYITGVT